MLAVCLLSLSIFTSCKTSNPVTIPTTKVSVTGVTLNVGPMTLNGIGYTEKLTATVNPTDATNKNVTWSSSNSAVVKVNSEGMLTSVGAGTATITVTTEDGNKTASGTVTVTIPTTKVSVTGVNLEKTFLFLTGVGATEKLTVYVNPGEATNKKVTWSSSNTAVATISADGMVKVVGAGKTTITVTTEDGSKTATSTVIVSISNTSKSLTEALNGYYWYLDGYKYAYVHPIIKDWFDHQILDWETENINLTDNEIIGMEVLSPENYYSMNGEAFSNTHNRLLVNPLDNGEHLAYKFNMYVKDNKMYINVGEKEYSFTRFDSRKVVNVSLNFETDVVNVTKGNFFEFKIVVPTFFENHLLFATSTDPSIAMPRYNNASSMDGNITMEFYALKVGTTKIVIEDTKSGASKAFTVNVLPISVLGVSLDVSSVELVKGSTQQLNATVSPSTANNINVEWISSDNSVATVSTTGKITAVGYGKAIITVKTVDSQYTASCQISVNYSALTVKANVGLKMEVSATGVRTGVFVEAIPSGGTEQYVEFLVKLYFNGTFIGESTENTLFATPAKNGEYRAEVYVKDSNGNETSSSSTTTISN